MRFSGIFQASFPVCCSGEPTEGGSQWEVCSWGFSHCYLCTGRTSPDFHCGGCGIFTSPGVCGCLGRWSLGSLKPLFAFHHPDEYTSSEEKEWNWAGLMNSLCVSSWGQNLRHAGSEEQVFASCPVHIEGWSLEDADPSESNPAKHLHMCLSNFWIRTSLLNTLCV